MNELFDEYAEFVFSPEAEEDEDLDEPDFDCGFVPGHGCQLAGTEDCDFDCPYRDSLTSHPSYPNVDWGLWR
jgi:hypothetical protein